MARAPRSFLLEQLRAQADAVAAKRVQQLKLSREVVDRIDQRMHAVFQYFDEATKLLQTISPPIERAFEQKSALEIVRSSAARRLMASIGPMAAMLRW